MNKDKEEFDTIISQKVLMCTNRAFHPITEKCSLFSSVHGMNTNINHILGPKTHFNQFKAIEITMNVFSDHNGMKIEINNKKVT